MGSREGKPEGVELLDLLTMKSSFEVIDPCLYCLHYISHIWRYRDRLQDEKKKKKEGSIEYQRRPGFYNSEKYIIIFCSLK